MTSTKHRMRFMIRRCSNRYDHFGRRVQKITPEATYTYFYDGWQLVKEVVERSGDTRRCGVSPRHCGGAGSSTSLRAASCRMRVVEEREASAAAVAKAFCEPSEFRYAVCRCSPSHILQ